MTGFFRLLTGGFDETGSSTVFMFLLSLYFTCLESQSLPVPILTCRL